MKPVQQIARGLGWFSLGLGLTELLGGEALDETFGTGNRRNLFRAFGLREIAAGLGILLSPRSTAPWLWARVAGDVLDLGALGETLRHRRTNKNNVVTAIAAVAGVTALDVFCAWQLTGKGSSEAEAEEKNDAPHAERGLTVGHLAEDGSVRAVLAP